MSKYIKWMTIFLFFIPIWLPQIIYAANPMPLIIYYPDADTSELVKIFQRDFISGLDTQYDSLFIEMPGHYHVIGWDMYDSVHRRIFFDEGSPADSTQLQIYEVDTHRYFTLPYDNYSGTHVDMVISPNSQYIIFGYQFRDHDTLWSPDQYKTVVLDGNTLNFLSERISLQVNKGQTSRVTRNNNYLINPEYFHLPDSSWEDAVVIYSLPNLSPIDSISFNRFEWRGYRQAMDYSSDGLLFLATKTDTTRGLPPGSYVFTMNVLQRRIVSRIIPVVANSNIQAKLTPNGDEIITVYPNQGKIRRYSVASGRLIAEINIPVGSVFQFFGEDGNLYVADDLLYTVINYRNNNIVRSFTLHQE